MSDTIAFGSLKDYWVGWWPTEHDGPFDWQLDTPDLREVVMQFEVTCTDHAPRRLDWNHDLKGWPTVCKSCGAEGFTQDPTVPRMGAVA